MSAAPDTKTISESQAETHDPAAAAVPLAAGSQIGKYQIRAQLGEGGMGAVFLAFDPIIEREVAIKVLAESANASPVALQRFLQEARSIGRLNHPHVVSIYDIDQWNGRYYLVMELLSGGSLADVIETRGPLPWQEACQLVAQAASGLAAAHSAAMVHRDIKPENLMITKDGIVKVVDFGLSKLVDAASDTKDAVTRAGQILGTPQYMSPEQFESADVDHRTDIYSLGGTLFRLLSGKYPFDGCKTILQVMNAHLTKPPARLSGGDADVPEDCDRIIARAMAKRPEDRYQSAGDLAAALRELAHRPMVFDEFEEFAEADDAARPLESALLVEPSKMLLTMMQDALRAAGVPGVRTALSCAEAAPVLQSAAPDLLVTALQLPDGQGLDLVSLLASTGKLRETCVVVNSSDLPLGKLIAAGPAAGWILAPKKSRPDDILRVVHAASPYSIPGGALAAAVDPLQAKLVVALDSDALPRDLTTLIRELGLLDITVLPTLPQEPVDKWNSAVVLMLRTAGSSAGDEQIYTRMVQPLAAAGCLAAAVQVDEERLSLRAVARRGVTGAVRGPLDVERFRRLLQAVRPA